MADNFQDEIPTARVNIKLDLHADNTKKKVELPLELLAVGNYNNGKEQRPLSGQDKISINKNSSDSAVAKFSPAVNLAIEGTPSGNSNEQNIALEFKSLKGSEPEQVTRNIPQLRVLLVMYNLLHDLRSNLLDNATFCRELENILKDPTLSSELRDELAKTTPQESV